MKSINDLLDFYKNFKYKLFQLEYFDHREIVMGLHYGRWHYRLKVDNTRDFEYRGVRIPLYEFWHLVEWVEMWDKEEDEEPIIYHNKKEKR